jgi:hypothetical protein
MPTYPNRLPLIPVSPLIQASIETAKFLATITQKLSSTPDDIILQKHLSTTKERLDQLTKNIESVQTSFFIEFSLQSIAQEIAYINSQLFRLVILDSAWITNFDKRVNMIPLLDFHRYLSHALAHEVIYHSEKDIISHLIQLAYILLFVYRDFSGCTAILDCLQMPEVQRLENAWNQCPPKFIKTFKDLLPILSPEGQYEAYYQTLGSLTRSFLNQQHRPCMIAIPFVQAHLRIIHDAPSAIQLLKFCQQLVQIDPALLPYMQETSKKMKNVVNLEQLKTNPSVYHWLVTRPYLTRSQLKLESLQIVPPADDEAVLKEEEEEDFYWTFYRVETIDSDLQSHSPPIKPSESLEEYHANVPQKVFESYKLPVKSDSEESSQLEEILAVSENNDGPSHSNQNDDIVIDNDDDDDEPILINDSKTDLDENDGNEEEDDTVVLSLKSRREYEPGLNIQKVDSESEKSFSNHVPTESDINKIKHEPSDNEPEQTHLKEVSQLEIEPKPTLSVTAAEFVPTVNPLTASEEEENSEEWTGYPISNVEEEEEEEEEENSEEWTGYPISNVEEEEDNSEEWTGYPISNVEEEEEDEGEVWTGYPVPEHATEEEKQDTSFETWDKNGQISAFEKVAARHIQHSLSSNIALETGRKGLPSPFASSSAST